MFGAIKRAFSKLSFEIRIMFARRKLKGITQNLDGLTDSASDDFVRKLSSDWVRHERQERQQRPGGIASPFQESINTLSNLVMVSEMFKQNHHHSVAEFEDEFDANVRDIKVALSNFDNMIISIVKTSLKDGSLSLMSPITIGNYINYLFLNIYRPEFYEWLESSSKRIKISIEMMERCLNKSDDPAEHIIMSQMMGFALTGILMAKGG